MKDIEDFLINKLKEKYIVDDILKYYCDDWEEQEFKKLKEKLYTLYRIYNNPYKYNSNFLYVIIQNLETQLTFLRYKIMNKYSQIGK